MKNDSRELQQVEVTAAANAASMSNTAAQAAPRVDLYAGIHKALRHFMSDTLVRIGRVDPADDGDLQQTLGQLDALLDFCRGHVEHENDFVHTAIDARLPRGAARTADDHVEHLASIDALRGEANALRAAAHDARPLLALRLYRHLALFVAENFQHMHVEETANNASLWAHYSDAELEEIHHRLVASIAPPEMMATLRWMVPAMSPAERAGLLNGAKQQMPPEAFLGVLQSLRPQLDDIGWGKLAHAVGVPVQLLAAG